MVMTRALVPVAVMAALLAVAAVMMEAAAAATYTVGAPDGLWDMQTDYAQWVKTKTFHPGDKITFTYSPELHDVVEVTEAGYAACSSANNISAFRTGNDVVALAAVGTRYFLCGLTGHCDNGMKIRVDVVSSAPGPAAAGPASAAAPPLARRWVPASAGIAAATLLLPRAVVARRLW
ncbi:stellacyanin-like [Panicum virgatum]|uniref:Phytocyanin domain-containing protein n=1 Tax=Panicum virgatum TaxID=38727 RepID=A0A8T0QUF9_PANVG|nr:stellacyanin-like [Panicum virgatum]KAG2576583.1 hypothetical protein PVAP13_6NG032200 [Panicum virgatum]